MSLIIVVCLIVNTLIYWHTIHKLEEEVDFYYMKAERLKYPESIGGLTCLELRYLIRSSDYRSFHVQPEIWHTIVKMSPTEAIAPGVVRFDGALFIWDPSGISKFEANE